MNGSKYFSQAVHSTEIEKGFLNIVKAPVGSGKSYWAINVLSQSVSEPYRILYLIDTVNGKEQLLRNSKMQPYQDSWLDSISRQTEWFGDCFSKDRIPVMTYAKFGVIAEHYPSFVDNLEIVICDEIHNLPRFSAFISGLKKDDKRYHNIAKEAIENAILRGRTTFIGLSATPKRAESEMNCPHKHISVDSDIRQFETKYKMPYVNLSHILENLSAEEKGLVYIGHITQMKVFEEEAKSKGFNPISIWSINNTNHPMNAEQLRVREYILKNAKLPPEYNMYIINASSETSINIFGNVDYVVVHSQEEETQIQVRGRYRGNLKKLFVYDQSFFPSIPKEYIGCRLSAEDTQKLCEYLNLRSDNGSLYKWTTVKVRLKENGYTVTDKRKNNKRYHIIEFAKNK